MMEYPRIDALCDGLARTSVQKLHLSNIDLDAVGLTKLATLFTSETSFSTALSEVNLENDSAIMVPELEALRKSHLNIKFTM